MTGLWHIETTGKPGVVHLAPTGTTNPLCQTTPWSKWRTPPKRIRGRRLCKNCADLVARRGGTRAEHEAFEAAALDHALAGDP